MFVGQKQMHVAVVVFVVVENINKNIFLNFLFLRDINMICLSTVGFRYYGVVIIIVNLGTSSFAYNFLVTHPNFIKFGDYSLKFVWY